MSKDFSRRDFLRTGALGAAALTMTPSSLFAKMQDDNKKKEVIQGFEDHGSGLDVHAGWVPVSDKKVKVGIAGCGICAFGAVFGFQDHPNVEVVAVTDLDPARCQYLANKCRCSKTYPSLEEMVLDPEIEAVYIATDAPSHFKHAMLCLDHGKHVACAVPAVFGSVSDAHKLYEKVKSTGLKYMMFETSMFHEDLYAMRQLYNAGKLGKIYYAEGEYFHFTPTPIRSWKGWRDGLCPQWYPTHANAYYICVTGGAFTEVTCIGTESIYKTFMGDNKYKNIFDTEIALYKTTDGGSARMGVSWGTPGFSGEMGRVRGQNGTFYGKWETSLPVDISGVDTRRPPLPPTMDPGSHGGSHGNLTNEFICSILEDRKPLIDIAMALNLTVPGIIAHKSAMQGGKTLKVPQFKF